jgi:hypothetical protein
MGILPLVSIVSRAARTCDKTFSVHRLAPTDEAGLLGNQNLIPFAPFVSFQKRAEHAVRRAPPSTHSTTLRAAVEKVVISGSKVDEANSGNIYYGM